MRAIAKEINMKKVGNKLVAKGVEFINGCLTYNNKKFYLVKVEGVWLLPSYMFKYVLSIDTKCCLLTVSYK